MLATTHDTLDYQAADDEAPISFWRGPFAQNVLPFLTSMILHVSIVAIAIITAKAIMLITVSTGIETVVPMSPFIPSDDPTAVPNPGTIGDPSRPARQALFPDVKDATGLGDVRTPRITEDLKGGGWGDMVEKDAPIGVGPHSKYGWGHSVGTGKGEYNGPGTADGVGLAPFGIPGGSTMGPRGTFVKLRVDANNIVFLMDASGSMMSKFDSLRVELRKAIATLRPPQSFNVIFFQQNGIGEVGKQLLFATPGAKHKADDFLDRTIPIGETHPEAGLEAAFAQHPQLIFLLTDGDFPDNKSVLDTIHRLDADKTVRVNTIAFIDRGEEYEKVLKQIAEDTGGSFRYVSEEDLSQP